MSVDSNISEYQIMSDRFLCDSRRFIPSIGARRSHAERINILRRSAARWLIDRAYRCVAVKQLPMGTDVEIEVFHPESISTSEASRYLC